ncbi:hypothetical protein ACP70R_039939 [Stipagrostis hirtigluma subsp. patula]
MADGLDRWRDFFRGAGAGICDVIENAILVAAADAPRELLHRRDRIAERLFTAHRRDAAAPPPSLGSAAASATPATPVEEDKGSVRRVAEKESKVDSSSNGAHGSGGHGRDEDDEDSDSDDERLRRAAASNYGHNYDDDDEDEEEDEQQAVEEVEEEEDHEAQELEALTNEIDEESQIVGEVLRIKELLLRKEDHSDATLFESLRRLQLMQLSVSTLKATEIGRAVNRLRKHNSQQIRHLVRTLIEGWKVLVDEWVSTTNAALADNSPGSSNPSVVDEEEEEEGLPSPPLDEGAFFATQTTSIQLSEFFDEMDEDGNLRHNNDVSHGNKRGNSGGRPANHSAVARQEPPRPSSAVVEKVQVRRPELTRPEPSMRQSNPQKPQSSSLQIKPHGMLNKQSKPSSFESGPGRPVKAAPQQKPFGEMKPKQTREHVAVETKPTNYMDKSRLPAQPSSGVKLEMAKAKINDDGLDSNRKLEAAKRRLQERYQEAENAKRQRTIQVMELGDIPKPKHQNRQPMVKSRNSIRNWANGRR